VLTKIGLKIFIFEVVMKGLKEEPLRGMKETRNKESKHADASKFLFQKRRREETDDQSNRKWPNYLDLNKDLILLEYRLRTV